MSDAKKAKVTNEAVKLLLECRDYIQKSYWATPGRSVLLMKIESFEARLTEEFSKEE